MEDYRLEQTGQEVQRILNGAAMDANLQAEVERATDAEGTLQDNIDAEEQARQDADGVLQQGIDDEAQRAKDAEEANAGEIEGIKALIPATATSANKLADTNYVNSSIQTATAEYRGDYNVVTDLHLSIDATHAQIETLLPTVIAEADKNDYCYVMIPTSAQTPTEIAKIERYKMTSEGWKFEYDVNNSTFTAEEWAAIKSGITSGLVAKLNALPTNADLLLLLAGKQDVLTFDSVPVPESNNPVKSGGVYSAIDDEKTARLNSDTAIHAELDGLQAKVPATASSDNKLVDQNQMNSSISTATATFRGDWNVVSDLHLAVDATRAQIAALLPTVISTADNNDYCYVEIPTSAETPTQIERVERFKYNGTAWAYEYVLNNSGFTAAQWAAINSMITSGLVAKLSALPTNADLLAMLAQKQDNLTFDSTPTENSTNPVTSGGVFAADKALSDAIEAILLLIPSAASALNKLVDTSLMNSSISTATATFRGTYNLVSDLGLGIDATEGQIAAALLANISTADNNDYAFVQIPTSAETPAQIARTDRYKFNGTAWAFEYTLNTSGFTAAQWAAINSTITSALVAKLNALPTAAELQEALGTLTSSITAINQKIPSTASQSNKLVDNASMESYIAQVINILDASFNVTSTDGHITLHITQVDGVITSVQVQSTDIASAAALTTLTGRVTTAEGNISRNTTDIANLQQLYNNLQQSAPQIIQPSATWPVANPSSTVIYRVIDRVNTPPEYYSDYMWNGTSMVLMATYNNSFNQLEIDPEDNTIKIGSSDQGKIVSTNTKHYNEFPNYGEFYYSGGYHFIENQPSTSPFRYKKISAKGIQSAKIYTSIGASGNCAIGFLDSNNNPISGVRGTTLSVIEYTANVPSNAAYIVFSAYIPSGTDASTWYWVVENCKDLERDMDNIRQYNSDYLSKRIYGDFPNYGEIYRNNDNVTVSLNLTSGNWRYKIIPSQGISRIALHTLILSNLNYVLAFLDSNNGFMCGLQGTPDFNLQDYMVNVPSGASYIFMASCDRTGYERFACYYELFTEESRLISYEGDRAVVDEFLGKRVYNDFPNWGEIYYSGGEYHFSQLSTYSAWRYKMVPVNGAKYVEAYVNVGTNGNCAIAFLDENNDIISDVRGDIFGKKKYAASVPSNAAYIFIGSFNDPTIDYINDCYYQLYGENSLPIQLQNQAISQYRNKISILSSTMPRKGCVVFNIDENSNSYRTLQAFQDLLKQYGIDVFTILAHHNTLPQHIDKLRQLYVDGNEIAVHGISGWSATDANLQTILSAFGDENIQVFGYSNHGTAITPSEIEVVKKYFQWNVRYAQLAWNDPDYLNAVMSLSDTPNDMSRISLEITYSDISQEVYQERIDEVIAHAKNAIDKAITDKGIIVFSMHSYNNFNGTPYTCPTEALEPILQYVKDKLDKGLCVTGTSSEIVEYYWSKRYNE